MKQTTSLALILLAIGTGSLTAVAGEPVPAEFRGDWVAASASCTSMLRFRVAATGASLINGADKASYGDIAWPTEYFGRDYTGIVVTGIPEFESGNSPFTIFFNADEQKGMTKLSILQGEETPGNAQYNAIVRAAKKLNQRFPLDNVPLKKCAGMAAAAAAPGGAIAATAKPMGLAVAAAPDPCGGSPRCFNAGAFVAEVMQVTATAMTPGARHHSVAFNVRFRNVSDQPVILAYRGSSSAGMDNFGNAFYWGRSGTYDTSVKGIGYVTGRSADPQFVLNPGQSRNATFNLIRFNAAPPIGTAWTWDVVIDELEIQPGQVIRSLRQNSINLTNLTAGTFNAAAAPGILGTVGNAATQAPAVPGTGEDVASKVIDLFKSMQKKQ